MILAALNIPAHCATADSTARHVSDGWLAVIAMVLLL